MEHLSLLAFLLGTLMGITAIAATAMAHQVHPARFLRFFAWFLGLVLLASMMDLSRQYLAINLGFSGPIFDLSTTIAIAAPTLLAIFFLLRTGEELLETSLAPLKSGLIFIAVVGLGIFLSNAAGFLADRASGLILLALQLALVAIFLTLSLRLVFTEGERADHRRLALRYFGLWIGLKSVADLGLVLMGLANIAGFETVMTLQGVFDIAAAAIVIVYVKSFALAVVPNVWATGGGASAPAHMSDIGITNRESEIISLVTQGLTNKEIAIRLDISPTTVRDHVSQIYRKTGARNRVQLTNLIRPAQDAQTDR